MNYAESKLISVSEIPVVDLASLTNGSPDGARIVAKALLGAATDPGFFYVKNHGVPWELVERARAAARAFFALPLDRKMQVEVNAHHRGFLRIGEAKMADYAQPDLKESFVWGLEPTPGDPAVTPENPFLCPNNWPAEMPELKTAVYPYYEAVLACGQRLLHAFAAGMDLPEDTFVRSWHRPIARGSIIYYPPQPPELGREQFGVAPHTDYGCLTILCQDSVGGLEVETKSGEWVTAHPIEETFVVNVGDLLSRWTNDGFASTPHRVVNKSGRERYSLVVAVDPDFDTVIDPAVVCRDDDMPHYPPVRCGDYILQRFNKAFAYRKI
jgi:isopenicillin N synthase-like dioxygenase